MRPESGTQFFRDQLFDRRRRLLAAVSRSPDSSALFRLLGEVDAALERIEKGTFGLCESCKEPIEPERLLADPLVCFCLDHLSEAERRELEHDLELARRIQASLLPRNHLEIQGWQVSYYYRPARGVSGDYCDVFAPVEGDGLLVLAGDIAGKGVAASLLMTHLHAIVRTLLETGVSITGLMERANHLFCQHTPSNLFATLVCVRAGSSGAVEIVNAGHCAPIWLRAGGTATVEGAGLPLGMFAGAAYEARSVSLIPGESLVLYTDGFVEARNLEGEEYGEERLRQAAARLERGPARALVEALVGDMEDFTAGAQVEDDLTVLALRRSGSGAVA